MNEGSGKWWPRFTGACGRMKSSGRCIPAGDWEGSESRPAEFLLFRLGASTRYLETRGHPRLRMRHVTFKIGIAERDR